MKRSAEILSFCLSAAMMFVGSAESDSAHGATPTFSNLFHCESYSLPGEILQTEGKIPNPERDHAARLSADEKELPKNELCSDQNPNPGTTYINADRSVAMGEGHEIYLSVHSNPWPGCSECGYSADGYVRALLTGGKVSELRPVSDAAMGLASLTPKPEGGFLAVSTGSKQLLNAIIEFSKDWTKQELIVPFIATYPIDNYYIQSVHFLPRSRRTLLCAYNRNEESWHLLLFDSRSERFGKLDMTSYREGRSGHEFSPRQFLYSQQTYPYSRFPGAISSEAALHEVEAAKGREYRSFLAREGYRYYPARHADVVIPNLSNEPQVTNEEEGSSDVSCITDLEDNIYVQSGISPYLLVYSPEGQIKGRLYSSASVHGKPGKIVPEGLAANREGVVLREKSATSGNSKTFLLDIFDKNGKAIAANVVSQARLLVSKSEETEKFYFYRELFAKGANPILDQASYEILACSLNEPKRVARD